MTVAAGEIKACCAAAYGSDAVRWLLGDRLHPGGAPLTARLIDALGAGPGACVADVACGSGASALQAAEQAGCEVVGIDLAPANVEIARAAAAAAGLADRARFVLGDAEALPLDDASADGVLCECALCTFPDKPAAVREIARVLRPGGVLALSDMIAEPGDLPDELRSLAAWIACIGDARPLDELTDLLSANGLVVTQRERQDAALRALVERADARLRLARALRSSIPAKLAGSIERALAIVAAARQAVASGALGYGTIVALRANRPREAARTAPALAIEPLMTRTSPPRRWPEPARIRPAARTGASSRPARSSSGSGGRAQPK
jgi:arsenite methyltransferase